MAVQRFTRKEIQAIVRDIFNDSVVVAPIGNHELKRHQVYCVHNSDKKFVFKYYYQDDFADREIATLKILQDTDFPSPDLVEYGTFGEDREWLLMAYINGIPMEKVMDKMTRENILEAFEKMGALLYDFHNLKTFDFFGDFTKELEKKDVDKSLGKAFLKNAERVIQLLNASDLPDKDLLLTGLDYIYDNLPDLDQVTSGHLCHQDFNPRNVMVARQGDRWDVIAVIDFEHTRSWDIEFDFCNLYIQYFYEDGDLEDAFFKGYFKDQPLGLNFRKKFDFYLIYNCLSICSWSYERAPEYYSKALQILKDRLREAI